MKFRRSLDYGLHALMYMTRHISALPLSTQIIARAEKIPEDYLAKILAKFARGGLIKTVRSPQAGYIFTREPAAINLLEIMELAEGEKLFHGCFLDHRNCVKTARNCEIYACWEKATENLRHCLSTTSLNDFSWSHPDVCHNQGLPAPAPVTNHAAKQIKTRKLPKKK